MIDMRMYLQYIILIQFTFSLVKDIPRFNQLFNLKFKAEIRNKLWIQNTDMSGITEIVSPFKLAMKSFGVDQDICRANRLIRYNYIWGFFCRTK